MDNGVYGLTKGQSSPTTELGATTSSTPFGKIEDSINPLELYLTLGASFIASGFSGQPRVLGQLITQGMNHAGFAIVHVQSPCTTYNDTFELIKGNAKKGIEPTLWDLPDDHDAGDRKAAYEIIQAGGLPIGIVYQDKTRQTLDQRQEDLQKKAKTRSAQELLDSFQL